MGKTVLVVDDIEAVRISLHSALIGAGHDVRLAAGASEAMEMIQLQAPDIVIADIWMPGVNGIQLIQLIRQSYPAIRVFAITGGGPKLSLEAAVSLAQVWGAEKVFIKPFEEDALVLAIDEGSSPAAAERPSRKRAGPGCHPEQRK